MKILKLPVKTKIKCECGCEFEFDYDDIGFAIESIYTDSHKWLSYANAHVICPFCRKQHKIKKSQ